MLDPSPSPPSPLPVAPTPPAFSAGAVIGQTFEVVGRNSFTLGVAALVVSAPSLVLALAGRSVGPASRFLDLFTGVLLTGVMTSGVSRAVRGEPPRVGAMLGVAGARFFALFGLAVGSGVLTLLGLLALVVPGAIVWAGLFVAAPALVADPRLTATEAMKRSWELTRGRRAQVLAVGLVFVAIVLTVGFGAFGVLALFGHDETTLGSAIGELVLIPAQMLLDAAPVVAFDALRAEREGVDPARVAAVFD